MKKNNSFYINRDYIFLISIIFVMLIFIGNSKENNRNLENYHKVIEEKVKNEEVIEKLGLEVEKRKKELEILELELMELKRENKEKISEKLGKIEIYSENEREKPLKVKNYGENSSEKKTKKSSSNFVMEKNYKESKGNKESKYNLENNYGSEKREIEVDGKKIDIGSLDLKKIKSYYLSWPVKSKEVISEFGERVYDVTGKEKYRRGVSVKAEKGEKVLAGIEGVVTFVGEKGEHGNMVELQRDDGLKVRYGNLENIEVMERQLVSVGDEIGEIGSSTSVTEESSLYYEVLIEEIPVNPMKFKYE